MAATDVRTMIKGKNRQRATSGNEGLFLFSIFRYVLVFKKPAASLVRFTAPVRISLLNPRLRDAA